MSLSAHGDGNGRTAQHAHGYVVLARAYYAEPSHLPEGPRPSDKKPLKGQKDEPST